MKKYNPIDCWLKVLDDPEIVCPGEVLLDKIDNSDKEIITIPALEDMMDWDKTPVWLCWFTYADIQVPTLVYAN